jgi:ribose transport system substrate-binding protein
MTIRDDVEKHERERGVMKRGRRTVWLALATLGAAFALTAVAACGGDDGGGGGGGGDAGGGGGQESVNVAVFLASAANTYGQAQLEGAQKAAQELGAEVTSFDAAFDTNKQIAQIQDATASGNFQAFAVSANDGNAVVPELENAAAQDIKVTCMLAPCGPDLTSLEPQTDGVIAHTGTSFPNNGRAIAELVVQACEGKDPCEVAYIPGLLRTAPYEKARLDGFRSVIDENAHIEIVAIQEGQYLADPALRVTQNILQANPGLDVIASSGDQMIVGAEEAVNDAGKQGEVVLVGNGASEIGVQAVKEGRWFGTAVYLPFSEGYEAAKIAIQAARGEEGLPTSVNTDELAEPATVINKENADQFEPEWAG